MSVKVEHARHLRVSARVVSVVGIIVEADEVGSIVDSAEGLVRERADAQVDLHGSLGVLELSFSLFNVVGELHSISKDKRPGLANICDFRCNGVVRGRNWDHDLHSHGDSDL